MIADLEDIIDNGLSADEEAIALLKAAIDYPTTHEKDKIIHEIKELWQTMQDSAEAVRISNSQKLESLKQLQIKEKKIQAEYDLFSLNTGFINQMQRNPPSDKLEKLKLIKEIEQNIIDMALLSSPDRRLKVEKMSANEDVYQLKTQDLLFSRLEELIYNLKKRILVVEDSTNSSIVISEKYGSVSNLLNMHTHLLEENEELKIEESKFQDDAMAKRRNLGSIAPALLANISVSMQKELSALSEYGAELPVPSVLPKSDLEFDLICNIGSDITFSKQDFGTNIDPDLVQSLEMATTTENKLALLKQVVATQNESINKLQTELETLRQRRYSSNSLNKDRLERLWELNDKFSSQILDFTEKIEHAHDDIHDLNKEILRSIKERQYLDEKFNFTIHKILPLIEEAKSIQGITNQNLTIFQNLSHTCLALVYSLLDPQTKTYQELKEYFLAITPKDPPKPEPIKVVEPPPRPPAEEDQKPHPDDPRKFFMMKPMGIKKLSKPRRSHISNTTTSIEELPEQTTPKFENPVDGMSRAQLLNFMSLIHDISETPNTESHYHDAVNGALLSALSDVRSHLAKLTDDYNSEMKSTIELAAAANTEVLRRPKADIETTIDTCPHVDDFGQTEEEEEPAGKGKKGKKPPPKKPPPKGKKK